MRCVGRRVAGSDCQGLVEAEAKLAELPCQRGAAGYAVDAVDALATWGG